MDLYFPYLSPLIISSTSFFRSFFQFSSKTKKLSRRNSAAEKWKTKLTQTKNILSLPKLSWKRKHCMNPKNLLKEVGIYDKMKGSLMESTHISIYSLQSGKHCHAILGGLFLSPQSQHFRFSPSWCHDGGVPAPARWARPVARGGGWRPGTGEGAGRALGGEAAPGQGHG